MKRNLSAIFPNGCTSSQRDELIKKIVDTYGTVVNWEKWSNIAKRLYIEAEEAEEMELKCEWCYEVDTLYKCQILDD